MTHQTTHQNKDQCYNLLYNLVDLNSAESGEFAEKSFSKRISATYSNIFSMNKII